MDDGMGMCDVGFDCKDSVELDLTYHMMLVCKIAIVLSSIAGLRTCFYFNTYSIPITWQFLLVMYLYFRPALTFAFISSIQGDSCLTKTLYSGILVNA